ncbi:hypothetical protein swp_3547 [Shewanella piezotolerans WP3]|uniref:Uncharacterized protein n=1 Tax=Shewanella piezotolerans (strain WP3 / JCM 13877) TaxID=225849 RepID=B8CQA9_SHEPW|nr:hypothetical protein swp_3547 [Shewanella piezotolerans WP3]
MVFKKRGWIVKKYLWYSAKGDYYKMKVAMEAPL